MEEGLLHQREGGKKKNGNCRLRRRGHINLGNGLSLLSLQPSDEGARGTAYCQQKKRGGSGEGEERGWRHFLHLPRLFLSHNIPWTREGADIENDICFLF